MCENAVTVGQALHISRNPKSAKILEQTEQDGADSFSEKANSSQEKHKTENKRPKLQQKMSQPDSLHSSKVSSPNSLAHNKKDVKQKLENTLKESDEEKLLHEQVKTDAELMEDCHETALPYEHYNMVIYGLPNFITVPQGGN